MDLIDEEHVAFLKIGQHPGQITCLIDLRPTRDVDLRSDRGGNDVGQARFPQTRRATQKDVPQGVPAALGRLHHEHQTIFHLLLTAEIIKGRWAERVFESPIRSLVGLIVNILCQQTRMVKARSPINLDSL